jgi:hypothetical protein
MMVIIMTCVLMCVRQLRERVAMAGGSRLEVRIDNGTFGDCAPGGWG